MKKHILYCRPAGGRFNWEKHFDLKNLPGKLDKYGRVKVSFEKYTPMKSLSQLGYYHAGILPFLERELMSDTGVDKDGWHQILKEKCGVKIEVAEGVFIYPKSHSRYTEAEMRFFITKVQQWVLEFFNVQIPPPTTIEDYL